MENQGLGQKEKGKNTQGSGQTAKSWSPGVPQKISLSFKPAEHTGPGIRDLGFREKPNLDLGVEFKLKDEAALRPRKGIQEGPKGRPLSQGI